MFRVTLHLRRRLAGLSLARPSDAARCCFAASLAMLMVTALGATSRSLLSTDIEEGVVQTSGAYVTTSDNWLDQLTNPSAWRSGRFRARSRPLSRREREQEEREARQERLREEQEAREERLEEERETRAEAMEQARSYARARGTFRTVCVRLCDGFFFPISFATTPDRFGADEAECNARCSSGARLYVYPNPGAEPEDMKDMRGQPYTALKNAFLFRTQYVEACTCKPHPWEQEALDRHRLYAERAQKGRRTVAAKVQPARRGNETQARKAVEDGVSAVPRPVDIAAPNPVAQPDAVSVEAPVETGQTPPTTESADGPQLPGSAMLLGAPEIKRPSRRAQRSRTAGKEPPRERRSQRSARESSGKPAWASRVFGGNY